MRFWGIMLELLEPHLRLALVGLFVAACIVGIIAAWKSRGKGEASGDRYWDSLD